MSIISKKVFQKGVTTLTNVLSKRECQQLIVRGEEMVFREASVKTNKGQKMMKSIRNNERVMFTDVKLADNLFSRMDDHLEHLTKDGKQPIMLNDYFRIYKYNPGQRFNQHKDGSEDIDNMKSWVSVLFYLNDDFTGGTTSFNHYVRKNGKTNCECFLSLKPDTGSSLLFWHNIFHKGDEVIDGIKYVLRTDLLYPADQDKASIRLEYSHPKYNSLEEEKANNMGMREEQLMQILKSGRPIDPNRPKFTNTITQEQLDQLWKETDDRRANSVYG